jgi:hypothetical protein
MGEFKVLAFQRIYKHVKTFATVVGGAALMAMCAVSALAGGGTERMAVVSSGGMTRGETATVQYSASMPTTSFGVPKVKAHP